MIENVEKQVPTAAYAGPGHWNDPDMLEIGNGHMTDDEYRTHMSLWSILAAPLLAGNDLRTMTPAIKEILTNREVIAVNQDKAGKQGVIVRQWDDVELWGRLLADATIAFGIFNRGAKEAKVTLAWPELGWERPPAAMRDLWAHKDLKAEAPSYRVTIPAHGVVMLKVKR